MNNLVTKQFSLFKTRSSLLFTKPQSICNYYTFQLTDKPIKNTHTTRPKVSKDRSIPLTYEQTQFAHLIGETKTWNSWNTSNLLDGKRQAESCYDDLLIRKFIAGTWQDILASEIIIKRKFNQINIIFQISKRRRLNPRQIYFLTGYSEELLSYLLKCVVKIEFQSVDHKDDLIFRYW